MFKRQKKQKPIISLMDEHGEQLFCGELEYLPIKESIIIQKSVEFFSDPSPCYLHKGAVTIRLLGEIQDMLSQQPQSLDFIIDTANYANILDYLDISGIVWVRVD